jgi:hypothetical protein
MQSRRKLYVPISDDALQKLLAIAEHERREIREQGGYLLENAIEAYTSTRRPKAIRTNANSDGIRQDNPVAVAA